MSKKINILCLFIAFVASLNAQQTYTIEGKVASLQQTGQIYLWEMSRNYSGFILTDSTEVSNGEFKFVRNLQENLQDNISMQVIYYPSTKTDVFFIAEPGTIYMQVSDTSHVEGTKTNDEFQALTDRQYSLQKEIYSTIESYGGTPTPHELDSLEKVVENYSMEVYNFIRKNIQNQLGEFMLLSYSERGMLSSPQILELVNLGTQEFKDSKLGIEMLTYYATKESPAVKENSFSEEPYQDVQLFSPTGEIVSLSDYVGKNKVVLIDFWASWCSPCIKEMPVLIEAYTKYKDKGFEIVGISLDQEKDKWLNAIDRLEISWPQMSDLGGWESKAALQYGIRSIPMTLLIDENGTIIANRLRGNAILTKLSELLD